MNEQTQRGMGGASPPARGATVCCPSCKSEVFRLARGASLAQRGSGTEQVGSCPKCGGLVRVFVAT